MSTRDFDPRRLDVAAFAKAGGALTGQWPLRELTRLAESSVAEAPSAADDAVVWQAGGESRPGRGGPPEIWLHLHARTSIALECQRCLNPVRYALDIHPDLQFVHSEEAAAQLDEEAEHDVLALTRSLDLRELVEDELLLALPIVPRHEVCPVPLPVAASPLDESTEPAHPFAALKALKGEADGD